MLCGPSYAYLVCIVFKPCLEEIAKAIENIHLVYAAVFFEQTGCTAVFIYRSNGAIVYQQRAAFLRYIDIGVLVEQWIYQCTAIFVMQVAGVELHLFFAQVEKSAYHVVITAIAAIEPHIAMAARSIACNMQYAAAVGSLYLRA